ncbi:MAG: patatin-like phospholipase family protein [Bacteroidota bacterium]
MKPGLFSLILILGLASIIAIQAKAQKVGLVLSGGGAKGVTHIGVIRALEEEGIPIDYITGTSMGAIIGGLYASGYSPDEIEAMITSPEFDFWLSGKVDAKYTYFFKKPEPDAAWADFRFRVDSVVVASLPSNLISPVLMDFAFMKIFAGASAAAGYNFDSLMVPFRCMASDIARTEPVVLKEGDLGSSIRASMTFPFYFKPIRIDGKLLFDGGMYNNFPSDIMLQDFFPDIIIGSQASSNYAEPEADNIISQIQNMLMLKSQYSVICENGVLIKPNMKKVNVIDFSNTSEFVDSGYVATRRKIAEIRSFVVTHVSKTEIEAKRAAFNGRKPPLLIGNFHVTGLKSGQFEYVNRILRKNTFGKSKAGKGREMGNLSLGLIEPEYFKLLSEGKIEQIYPRLFYNNASGFYDLLLDVKSQNQMLASVGGAVTSSAVNELFLQFQYNNWNKNSLRLQANAYFGRFYNSGMIESRIDFPRRVPFSLKAQFIFNKFNFFKTNTYFFEDEDPYFLIERDNFLLLAAGFPVTNDGLLTFEFQTGTNRDDYYQTNLYSKYDTLDKTMFRFYSPGIVMEFNNLNRKEFASSGARLSLKTYMVFGRESYFPGSTSPIDEKFVKQHTWVQAQLIYENYFFKNRGFRMGVYGEAHFSSQNFFSNYSSTILASSAFQPVPESRIRFMPQFRANKYLALGSRNVYSLRKNIDWRLEAYLFLPTKGIVQIPVTRRAGNASELRLWPMASSSVVYFSPVGPISLSVNYFNGENNPWSFFLKFGYLIFNKRPL